MRRLTSRRVGGLRAHVVAPPPAISVVRDGVGNLRLRSELHTDLAIRHDSKGGVMGICCAYPWWPAGKVMMV